MKKSIKHLVSALFMTAFVVAAVLGSGNSLKAQAASKNLSLTLNDQFVTGRIDQAKAVNIYSFSIPQAGWLTITYQGWNIEDSYYHIYNYDMTTEYHYENVCHSTDLSPIQRSYTVALEKGDYKVKIDGYGNHYGDYKIKGSFTPAGNNETEPNNYWDAGMLLNKDTTVTGFLSRDDKIDIYKVNVPQKMTVRFLIQSRINDIFVELWNQEFVKVYDADIYYGSEQSPKTYSKDILLEPGLYYFKVKPYGDNNGNLGRYQVKWGDAPTPVSAITITGPKTVRKGETIQLKADIMPTVATNKTLTWSSNNTYVATVDANGKVKGINEGTTTIVAKANDDSGCYSEYQIEVKKEAKKASNASVSKVASVKTKAKSGKKIEITWKKQKSAKRYEIQIATNKKFNKNLIMTTVKGSKNKLTYKYFKKGTAYVRVRAIGKNDKVGAWSKAKKVKVR